MMKRHLAGIAMVVILCCMSASSAKAHPSAAEHWTAITEVDTKKKPGRRITRHYAALLRISNGVRPYFISIRS